MGNFQVAWRGASETDALYNRSTRMTARHFERAPVVEAIVDIQISILAEDSLGRIKGMRLPLGYRLAHEIRAFSGQFNVQEPPVASVSTSALGYAFVSEDTKFVTQARLNGFTFSRMAPYDRWETFIQEAQTVWNLYREAIGESAVTQFSVRFINKLHLPNSVEISLYLKTFPEISKDLPQSLQNSFMRVELILSGQFTGGVLVVQEFLTNSDKEGHVGMILDNELRFPLGGPPLSDTWIWKRIDSLRELKNQVFRGSITQKLEEMIA
jgi:uncharacterized protein (TIGR04255 family)